MFWLLVLSAMVLVAAFLLTEWDHRLSPIDRLIAVGIVWTGLIETPIYVLALLGRLTRDNLRALVVAEILAVLIWAARGRRERFAVAARHAREALSLPLTALAESLRARSVGSLGLLLVLLGLPWLVVVAYYLPTWRNWDCLWYHEPFVALAIQDHGFGVVPVPEGLSYANGFPRACEMMQLWFAIQGGRRVLEWANIFTAPILLSAASGLWLRYSPDRATAFALGAAFLLLPGNSAYLLSTMADPQAAGLFAAGVYFATHLNPTVVTSVLAGTALGWCISARFTALAPVGLCLLLGIWLTFRARSGRPLSGTLGMLAAGGLAFLGPMATTYVRNWVVYGHPLYPVMSSGSSTMPSSIDPSFSEFLTLASTPPGGGESWRAYEWGFGAWLLVPVVVVCFLFGAAQWLGAMFGWSTISHRRRLELEGALLLTVAVVVATSLSPAKHIARYSIGGLAALIPLLAIQGRRRLGEGLAPLIQYTSVLYLLWIGQFSIVRDTNAATKRPYALRELDDGLRAPVHTPTGVAREAELKAGSLVVFDRIQYYALLWNNDFSNRVVWLGQEPRPLDRARSWGAQWVYTQPGTELWGELASAADFEQVGRLEAEQSAVTGYVFRRK